MMFKIFPISKNWIVCLSQHNHLSSLRKVKRLFVWVGILFFIAQPQAQAQDVILQGFYWNSHPGDLSNLTDGGVWWDTLTTVAPELGNAGFATVWTPPPTKSFAGKFDMGYGPYDYFDLGEFDSKGTVRTRHGNRSELDAMIGALHANGVQVMADIVLNHRGGGDGLAFEEAGPQLRFLIYNPPSGRLPSGPEDFHPNNFHPDENPPFHDPIFFEDVCYFNRPTSIPPNLGNGTPGRWYFGAPNLIGEMGTDLMEWGRYLIEDVGFDELRLDAIKHIEPDFLAKFIIESKDGTQPFALGEFFDFSIGALQNYHSSVENSSNSGGVKSADMSMFDFPLRGSLQSVLNDVSGNADLFQILGGTGLVWGSSLAGDDVVTWLDTHDTDRIGYEEDENGSCSIPFGGSCLRLTELDDHNPIFFDKEDMGYPFLMAAEGRPIVFWKDYFWFGMSDDIRWLMALRNTFAKGGSDHIRNLNGVWPTTAPYDGDNNGGNMFAMRRDGTTGGVSDGLVLGLNDHPTKTNAVFVNTPFTNKFLKDYSDGFMFETSQAFGDGRALIKAQARDYSWYAPTGLYPQTPDGQSSHFNMDATPGGCVHFLALRVGDATSFVINNAAIAVGDEVAVKNAAGQVVGIGRIGQNFAWDGVHDMIIEVLGAPSTNGMTDDETLRIFVFDASTGQEIEAGSITYANPGASFSFSPDRPDSQNRNGNVSTFTVQSSAQGAFICDGISLVTGFSTLTSSCIISSISAGNQSICNPATNTYSQEIIVTYSNAPNGASLEVNGQVFTLTQSPQTVTLTGLTANGAAVNVTASLGNNCTLTNNALFTAPNACNAVPCSISSISAGNQSTCNPATNTYSQEITVTYNNAPNGASLEVNGQVFTLTQSPQTVTLTGLTADGAAVNVTASLGNNCTLTNNTLFTAPNACNAPACESSNANATAYNDSWTNGDNDGSGFSSWQLSTQNNNSSTAGHFIFTSTENGDGDQNSDGDVDTGGESFGMYASNGDVSSAIRPFNNALTSNETLKFAFDNGYINNGGTVGWALQNASGQNLLEGFFIGGQSNYSIHDASGINSSGIGFTDEGLSFEIQVFNNGTYSLQITPLLSGVAQSFNGSLINAGSGQSATQLRFFNANSGTGASHNMYFNQLEICTQSGNNAARQGIVENSEQSAPTSSRVRYQLYPNPLQADQLTLQFEQLVSGKITFEIRNEQGILITSGTKNVEKRTKLLSLDLKSLSLTSGVYLIKVRSYQIDESVHRLVVE